MKNFKTINLFALFSILFLFSIGIFAQTDVLRKTVAVTYPVDETVMLQFRGTTRFPRMKGDAKIQRTKKNGTEINLSVSKMPRPFELGAGYATYVVWAISPDGQVDNLGEIKRRGFFDFDSKMSVTTPLQTFALIITAEPHFLVRRPSRAIMLENLNPNSQSGRTLATITAIEYFGNSSDYFSDARTPEIAEIDYSKTPSTVLQAKQAVALARFAGAQRDAAEELRQAETLLQNADNVWKAGRAEDEVDITARKAISAAVKAEDTALVRKEARKQRNEKTRQDAEIRQSEEKVVDAQNQIADVRAELARETRDRELAERDAQNYASQVKDLRNEIAQLREELSRVKSEAENSKAKIAAIESEKQAIQQQKEQADRLAQLQSNEAILMQLLRKFGTVEKNERGIVLTLPENYFSGIRVSNFAPASDAKINSLGEVLSSTADYKIMVESHTDNKGIPDELQTFTQERAQTFMDKLIALGVTQNRIEAKGYGASLPVAPNTTNASRAKNRRVQILLIPSVE
ncbi:MAG TPA: OmpA family protein [Pyrinomonadaceae bacterium]|nr:OmpA family protein [Pyrinomonadaceae bacterium]